MVRLPLEYQEVEYLKSTGEQWIDTGVFADSLCEVKCAGIWHAFTGSSSSYMFGSYGDGVNFGINITASGAYCLWKSSSTAFTPRPTFDVVYDIRLKLNTLTVDGINANYAPDSDFSNSQKTLYLFWANGTSQAKKPVSIYKCGIYKSNELLRNFIPCYRKSDNEPGMYDTVSKTFYTNSGTGTFLVGNDVSWDTASLLERRRQILLNTPHIETVSDTIVNFNTDMVLPIKKCKIKFLPIQTTNGAIYGYDLIDIAATGKNKLPAQAVKTNYRAVDGKASSSTAYNSWCIPVPYGRGIVMKWRQNRTVIYGFFIRPISITSGITAYNNKVLTSYTSASWTASELSLLARRLVIATHLTSEKTPGDFWKNYGYISLDFLNVTNTEPAQGNSYGIILPETIYGGSLDVLTGVLSSEWGYIASYDGESLPGEWISSLDVYEEGTIPTIGAQVAYKLAEPVIYQLDPIEIKTLKGINNIWSNANGNIEVSYFTH